MIGIGSKWRFAFVSPVKKWYLQGVGSHAYIELTSYPLIFRIQKLPKMKSTLALFPLSIGSSSDNIGGFPLAEYSRVLNK